MKCLVIGAGNAGRPVAKLLNYKDYKVTITDPKKISDFKVEVQHRLKEMGKNGIKLDLGNPNPDIEGFDFVYKAPTLPDSAPIAKKVKDANLKVLTNEEFSKIFNDTINVDIIGITGTMGKTTTTNITSNIFKEAGYKVWSCSSLTYNLVSEAIIDGIISGKANDCDIAIFELPHGTIGLLNNISIKIGLLTNIAEDHLSEFGGSLEKYIERKKLLEKMSEIFISNKQCENLVKERTDVLYYGMKDDLDNDKCDFIGINGDKKLTIKYGNNEFTSPFYMMSYFFENATGASAIALKYGIDEKSIIKGLSSFKGLPCHMEEVFEHNGRRVILDSAFIPKGMKITLDYFKNENLILFLDHWDTETKRDKKEIGKLCGQYAKVIIASGFNEVNQTVEMEAANELLGAVENPDVKKIATKSIEEAAELTFKYSKPGDLILHMGPLLPYDRETTFKKIMKGLKEGSKKYE